MILLSIKESIFYKSKSNSIYQADWSNATDNLRRMNKGNNTKSLKKKS